MNLREHLVNGGRIVRDGDIVRLVIPATSSATYADAQLDDYDHEPPRAFVNRPPQRLNFRVRFSHPTGVMKGTAGFGFWNHPFTREGGVIAPPQNAWFFYGSPESDMQLVRGVPGHGFKAAMLSTPLPGSDSQGAGAGLTGLLIAAGNLALRLPIVSRMALAVAHGLVVAREVMLDLDMTDWHEYALDWLADEAVFRVDGSEVMRATRPPRTPLGFVAWVDNYRATASMGGEYAFGFVDVPEPQWIEVQGL
jgi:hypothetical protein